MKNMNPTTDHHSPCCDSTGDRLLTVDDLAAYLHVSKKTVYTWQHRRTGPPYVRAGKHLRFRASAVDKWLEGDAETPLRD